MANVLVIDDNDVCRKLIETILVRAGHRVLSARDGYSGIALCLAHRPDIIVTDILMPDKDGLAMINDLKQELPGLKIIAVSGGGSYGPDDYLRQAERLGADFSFTKPFEKAEFIAAVDELIAQPDSLSA